MQTPPIVSGTLAATVFRDIVEASTSGRIAHLLVKIRDLIADLERAGFVSRGGKGSHRNFTHERCSRPITISGKVGEDAKHYQVRAVRQAIRESQK